MSLFQLLADQVMGTNISGMNGGGMVQITEQELHYANQAINNNQSLAKKNEALQNELMAIRDKYERSLSQLEFAQKDSKSTNNVIELIYGEVGSADSRISENKRADYFVRTQYFALLKRFGIERTVAKGDVREQLTHNQQFTFNVYMIANADYMLMQTYLASVLAAMNEVIKEADSNPQSELSNQPEFKANITSVRDALSDDLVTLARVDSNAYMDFHKSRVKVIAKEAKLIPGTVTIEPSSVPPISCGQIDQIMKEANAIGAVKSRITDAGAKKALQVHDNDALIPSAYATGQFGIKSWTV